MEVKRNVIPCPNGHYYNASIHACCPLCGDIGRRSGSGKVPSGGFSPAGSCRKPEFYHGNSAFPATTGLLDESNDMGPTISPDTSTEKNSKGDFPETVRGGDSAAPGQVSPVVGI